MRRLRIAMIGQRGVPATFGGIEHHVEELGSRLAARGHEVIVFNPDELRAGPLTEYRGMHVRSLPTVSSKHLDAIVHSGLATLATMASPVDVVHYHAIGPGIPAVLPPYASRSKVVLTVHGLDSERAKWGRGARAVLKVAEWLSARVPDATIVVSRDLAEHYRRRYHRRTWYIPNGVVEPTHRPAADIAERFGLTEGSYLVFVGRLVPEKAPDLLIRAFRRIPGDLRLVIAGGSSFTDEYVRSLHALADADPRVLMTGYVYGPTLDELYTNAAAFVLPSSLEGLPLTLLEAASYGPPVVASDIPPNLEIVGSEGPGRRVFHTGDEAGLAAAIERALADPAAEREAAARFRSHVLDTYRWDEVADRTESLYERLTIRRR